MRIVAYAIMIPAALVFSLREWNRHHPRLAGLFALYSAAHVIALASVVLRLYGMAEYVPEVSFWLTPIVIVQALLYIWGTSIWLREQRRERP